MIRVRKSVGLFVGINGFAFVVCGLLSQATLAPLSNESASACVGGAICSKCPIGAFNGACTGACVGHVCALNGLGICVSNAPGVPGTAGCAAPRGRYNCVWGFTTCNANAFPGWCGASQAPAACPAAVIVGGFPVCPAPNPACVAGAGGSCGGC